MKDLEFIKEQIAFYLKHEEDPHFMNLAQQLQKNGDANLLEEYFGSAIAFGTAGLRGLMQPGFNCINPITVHLASQGLGLYIKSLYTKPLVAIVSYDTRLFSKEFAIVTARSFASLGIQVDLFSEPTPVPLLSYAIRNKKADFGVMITASHNPKEYNGYKVYWSAGEQVVAPHDTGIEKSISQCQPTPMISLADAQQQGLIRWIDEEVLQSYQEAIFTHKSISLLLNSVPSVKTSKICYTPLHGSGYQSILNLLHAAGFTVTVPPEQQIPDGSFPTVKVPNPEEAENLHMAIELAKKEGSSLVMATDPDADRLGLAVLHEGTFITLTGNEIGALVLHFIADTLKKSGKLSSKALFVNTVVTTPLQNIIAKDFGIASKRILTGFKHIADAIAHSEATGDHEYLFGCEESYGYLIHSMARDKDAVSVALLIAVMHEYYTLQNTTLYGVLQGIYKKYGYHLDRQLSYTCKGLSGADSIKRMMDTIAAEKPNWAASAVCKTLDYRQQKTYDAKGALMPNAPLLPNTNLIQFELEDGTLLSARPSGTEPKIKFYVSIAATDEASALVKMDAIKSNVNAFVQPYL
jgi:phosphoglucomutase